MENEPFYNEETEPIDDRPRISWSGPPVPVLTCVIIVLNIAIFLFINLRFGNVDAGFFAEHGGMYPPAVASGAWWRLLTCTFLHVNTFHLMNNMIMLFAAGAFVEDALGRVKFLVLYFGSGFFASLASYLHAGPFSTMVSVGASGAIFGVVGALVWVVVRNKGRYRRLTVRGMLFMLILSVYYGFSSGGLVDNAAHLGGLAAGFVLSILLYRHRLPTD